jgi:dTDP-glucose 4,6-dehydratase
MVELVKGKRALVTGADGFIGSHLVERLVVEGWQVKAFVMYNSFNTWGWLDSLDQEVLKSVEVLAGDIRDPVFVRNAMQGCDMVFHLAALIAIPFSYSAPNAYVETNVNGTLNILQAARELGVARVVHTSTSEVYGSAQFVPITEKHPIQCQSPYAATKSAADQLATSFHLSFDVPVSVIRPFNTYGPRQSGRAVIPAIITQIRSGHKNIKLGALTPTRDFNYVADTVSGFVAIAQCEASIGKVLNVGSGFEISIEDLVMLISELMGESITVEQDVDRLRPESSEVDRLCADASLLRELTSWQPSFEGIEGLKYGLRETIEWFSDKANYSKYKDMYTV